MARQLKIVLLSCLISIVIAFSLGRNHPDGNLHLIFCDVGQGDGIIIQTPKGSNILVDGGPSDNKMVDCLDQHTPFYQRKITLALMTHLHADHIGGLIDIYKSHTIKTIISNQIKFDTPEYQELNTQLQQHQKSFTEIWANDQISVDGITFSILWPYPNSWNHTNGNWEAYLNDFNDSSIVALVSYKNFQSLLTGDAGLSVMEQVISGDPFKRSFRAGESIRILKYPHHGSKDALSLKMLDIFQPQEAIISVGKRNKYGHPNKESIDELNKRHITVYRTDQLGTIELITNGYKLWKR